MTSTRKNRKAKAKKKANKKINKINHVISDFKMQVTEVNKDNLDDVLSIFTGSNQIDVTDELIEELSSKYDHLEKDKLIGFKNNGWKYDIERESFFAPSEDDDFEIPELEELEDTFKISRIDNYNRIKDYRELGSKMKCNHTYNEMKEWDDSIKEIDYELKKGKEISIFNSESNTEKSVFSIFYTNTKEEYCETHLLEIINLFKNFEVKWKNNELVLYSLSDFELTKN